MQEIENSIEIERKIDNFAVQTINDVEKKSKILLTAVGQITDVSNLRKWYWKKYQWFRRHYKKSKSSRNWFFKKTESLVCLIL